MQLGHLHTVILFVFESFFFLFGCLPHPWPWQREVPEPGIELELELGPTPRLQQRWILNPLCRAGERTGAFIETRQILNPLLHSRNALYLNLEESETFH